MKILAIIIIFLSSVSCAKSSIIYAEDFLDSVKRERQKLELEKSVTLNVINLSIISLEFSLDDPLINADKKLSSLIEIRRLEREMMKIENEFSLKLTKFRYKKGIEVLKMVYEKILSLDHHFATLRSFQDIAMLSNPNSYPEFVKIKENLKNNTKSKNPVNLPDFLDNNPLVAMGYTVVSSFFGTGNKKQRTTELSNISCLLDFTLSMNSDLKIIYYETDFLRLTNNDLKSDCLKMFTDYIKVINYNYSLEYCRDKDDWDKVYSALDTYVESIGKQIDKSNDHTNYEIINKVNNLEFSVYRLLKFIEDYSKFIHQCEKYYQKFLTILRGYQNKDLCFEQLPQQYLELEKEVKTSIEKFETAYKIAELKGTKLRDLLYGNSD